MPETVAEDVVVSISYHLYDAEIDSLIEKSNPSHPMVYLHGHPGILPELEKALTGLKVGDTTSVTLTPENAYGERFDDRVRNIPLEELPDDIVKGMPIHVMDEEGNQYTAWVKAINNKTAILDFNHPLAGQHLRFEVEIMALREAAPEELAHGHAHEDGHHHH